MNAFARIAVLSLPILALAACASAGGTTGYTAARTTSAVPRIDKDSEYMARVEATARRRGVDVTWVNPPVKVVARDD